MNLVNLVQRKVYPYIYPHNPIDQRFTSRIKRGLLNYAQVKSWWCIPKLKQWIRHNTYNFTWHENKEDIHLVVSGDDLTHIWVANELLIEKVYDLSVVSFIPDLVIDLGSNIGLFTILAAKRWKKSTFVCVEPHPKTFNFLCKNLDKNQVIATKLQCAIDNKIDIKYLINDGAVFQELSEHGPQNNKTLTILLDSLIGVDKQKSLLLKIDIEGAENRVLESIDISLLPEKCFIFLELHYGQESLNWIERWACKNKFKFFQVRCRDNAIDGYLVR